MEVTTLDIPHTEALTYVFDELQPNATRLLLMWEKRGFPLEIKVDVGAIVLSKIREDLKGQIGFTRTNWEQAAVFALNNNGNLDEALQWVNAAIDGQFFSEKTAGNLALKARILKAKGDMVQYKTLMDEAAAIASVQQLNTLGYQMLNEKDFDAAIGYFKMAIEQDPKNANAYDSLGDAYKTMGNKKEAIKYFKKALSMNPPANVKASSERHLRELDAM